MKTQRILRTSDVCSLLKLGRTTIWRLENKGEFPKKVKLTILSVGYLESDILNWINERQKKSNGIFLN
jgi:prophage regulatory protein